MKLSTKFIKASNNLCDFDNHVNAPYIRKQFTLNFIPQKAEITICGLGFYEVYINGTNITKGALAPYISNTNDVCYYDNYDISNLLTKGENVVGILLGNGMRNSLGGIVWDFDIAPHRGPVTAALCIEATDDENNFELEADETFKTHPSAITFDDLRMGCRYDARLEIPNWNTTDFDDSKWDNVLTEKTPQGIKKICSAEPIKVTDRLKPVKITHYDELPFAYTEQTVIPEPLKNTIRENVYVYDFGINMAGVTELKINGYPGQKITIHHGESTVDGKFTVNSTVFQNRPDLRRCDILDDVYLNYHQVDEFICKGGEEIFTPKFKYDGFRYAYVEGLTKGQATSDALTYLVMNTDLKVRAGFECSDDVLNTLQEMTRRSDLSNFYYFPTDCPHREKNGWTADAALSAEHMLLNLTAEKSLKEWLYNISIAQAPNGALPGIVPTGGWGFDWGNGPAWDCVCTILPYYIYKYTGDKSAITENAAMIMRYLYYVSTRRDERDLVEFGLGDWLDPFQYETNNGVIASPLCFTDSAMVFDIATKAAFLFNEVGLIKESDYAKAFANEMRTAIRNELIDFETMTVIGDCQTSQAVSLEIGLFDEAEKSSAEKKLVDIIHRDGDILTCGVIGTRHIFHALVNAGEASLAYKIITNKERTGYGYWIENGSTTLWEAFIYKNKCRGYSKNHHFLGDISSLFIQEFAGLKPNPECNDISYFKISPNFIPELSYANAYYNSSFGKIETSWKREDNKISLSVILPPKTHAKISLPKGYIFEDGTYFKEINKNIENYSLEIICKTEN